MCQGNAENPPEPVEYTEHDYTLEEVQDIEEREAERALRISDLW
jgi:hypothetical protein